MDELETYFCLFFFVSFAIFSASYMPLLGSEAFIPVSPEAKAGN